MLRTTDVEAAGRSRCRTGDVAQAIVNPQINARTIEEDNRTVRTTAIIVGDDIALAMDRTPATTAMAIEASHAKDIVRTVEHAICRMPIPSRIGVICSVGIGQSIVTLRAYKSHCYLINCVNKGRVGTDPIIQQVGGIGSAMRVVRMRLRCPKITRCMTIEALSGCCLIPICIGAVVRRSSSVRTIPTLPGTTIDSRRECRGSVVAACPRRRRWIVTKVTCRRHRTIVLLVAITDGNRVLQVGRVVRQVARPQAVAEDCRASTRAIGNTCAVLKVIASITSQALWS